MFSSYLLIKPVHAQLHTGSIVYFSQCFVPKYAKPSSQDLFRSESVYFTNRLSYCLTDFSIGTNTLIKISLYL